jgi:acetyl-CoA carboxylase carboxyl transferase subunit alpha
MDYLLEFEKPVYALENQIRELEGASNKPNIDLSKEILALRKKVDELILSIYQNLTPWERVQLARHPLRPHAKDYIETCVDNFYEIHGDRRFADDHAVIAGLGYWGNQKVAVIGIEKGRKTQERITHNFGMPNPEGYRKALRLFQLAEQFSIPVITLIDTPGAYPGLGAEERGQAYAIAENLEVMSQLKVPTISLIIGEGGSGGALALAITDLVMMLEYSVYSVISPESCASILWSDPKLAEKAANSLKLTAPVALELKVVDELLKEPAGGAHRDTAAMISEVKEHIGQCLQKLKNQSIDELLKKRYEKFRSMGNQFLEKL